MSLMIQAPARGAEDAAVEIGVVFPDFELARTDGSTYHLADHEGRPKLVLFWATWCPYCRRLMPAIVALHDDFRDRGLSIVAVNFRDDGDTAAYAQEFGIDFDIVLEGDALAMSTGVNGTPTMFFLDRANRVVLRSSNSDPDNPVLRATVLDLLRARKTDLGTLLESAIQGDHRRGKIASAIDIGTRETLTFFGPTAKSANPIGC